LIDVSGGGELGWQRKTLTLLGLPFALAAGITYDYQGEQL